MFIAWVRMLNSTAVDSEVKEVTVELDLQERFELYS